MFQYRSGSSLSGSIPADKGRKDKADCSISRYYRIDGHYGTGAVWRQPAEKVSAGSSYFYNILIALAISAVVSAVLTYLLSLKFEAAPVSKAIEAKEITEAAEGICYTPIQGEVIPLEDIGDGIFSAGVLGQGCGIRPTEGKVYAPFDGEIILLADTKHAIGIRSKYGAEVMIHVGLETVELNGQGFEPLVTIGEQVSKGQLLMNFDLDMIGEKYPTVTAFLVTNSPDFAEVALKRTGISQVGEPMLETKKG